MIKATLLHETFRGDINRVNSDYLKSISVVDVDRLLSNTWKVVYENLVQKAEVNSLVDDQIRQKLKRNQIFTPTKGKEFVKITYPNDLYRVIRRSAVGCLDGCNSKKIKVHPAQTSDLNESLSSDYWSPSWEWEETFSVQDDKGLIVYHNCKFDINEIVLDYYTKPRSIKCPSLVKDDCYKVSKGQYIDHANNIVTVDEDFEVDSTDLWLKVAHLAASAALMNTGDLQDYKALVESIMLNEKIFL